MSYFIFLGCRKRTGKDVVADRLIDNLNSLGIPTKKESCIGYARNFVNDLLPDFAVKDEKDNPYEYYNNRTERETIIGVVDSILKCDELAFLKQLVNRNNPIDETVYIIPDCRRMIEGKYAREHLEENSYFVNVERSNTKVDYRAYGEGDMDDFDCDYFIDNNGSLGELILNADILTDIIFEKAPKGTRIRNFETGIGDSYVR